MVIKRKDGKNALIEKVLFVSGIECNMLSIEQLVEKDFSLTMTGDAL